MPLLDLPNELFNSIAEHLESEGDVSALSQASRCLHKLLTPYLYRHNAQWSGSSALLWAAENGQDTMVKYSVAHGGDVHAVNNQGQTPLLLATRNRHLAMVKFLLDENAEKESKDSDGRTPLS
jgi:ankyrin repeat protein